VGVGVAGKRKNQDRDPRGISKCADDDNTKPIF